MVLVHQLHLFVIPCKISDKLNFVVGTHLSACGIMLYEHIIIVRSTFCTNFCWRLCGENFKLNLNFAIYQEHCNRMIETRAFESQFRFQPNANILVRQ